MQDQRHFEEALKLVSLATDHLHVERFMTLLFELGYANRDGNAHAESLKHYDRLLSIAPAKPNAHWARQLKMAKESADLLRLADKLGVVSGLEGKPACKLRGLNEKNHQAK